MPAARARSRTRVGPVRVNGCRDPLMPDVHEKRACAMDRQVIEPMLSAPSPMAAVGRSAKSANVHFLSHDRQQRVVYDRLRVS